VPQGISIHIGLNEVDPAHYGGWSGKLNACEADAGDMARIAGERGFDTTTILTADATADAVTSAIGDAAGKVADGDILFCSYSGHGGQVPDTNNQEEDQLDETWVLFDRQLVDDEMFELWSKFPAGARILVFSDSCHSGSVNRDIFDVAVPHVVGANMVDTKEPRTKDLPKKVAKETYAQNKDLYDGIQERCHSSDDAEIGATVLLISGCQDNQLSLDGDRNGLFTQQVLAVWDDGQWTGSHPTFHKAVAAKMPPTQSPNYSPVGAANAPFEHQTPLTI
jgi:metacaspase-1